MTPYTQYWGFITGVMGFNIAFKAPAQEPSGYMGLLALTLKCESLVLVLRADSVTRGTLRAGGKLNHYLLILMVLGHLSGF